MKTEKGKNQESQYSKSKGTDAKEIKHINDLILAKIYSNLFTKRVNALELFAKNYEDLKIEI